VAGVLTPATRVVIRSHRTDTYGRFLADLFYLPRPAAAQTPRPSFAAHGVFLNQELLDKGLTVRMAE
jgi:endonuclease YncB( thermonuclease family)